MYNQFNGRYDFTFIGNTMNTAENNTTFELVTTTSSTATLSLNSTDVIEKAYLYWAGSGDGDFEVNLNSDTITPDRTFSFVRVFNDIPFTYFSAFKDITSLIQAAGNGDYTLSNLDISAFEELHFQRRTNFAGWAIVIIYKNDMLPLNQVNVYDGLQGVPDELSITLNSLNVIDDNNSKVGFVAWEGDSGLATEQFRMNGTLLSNTLNPPNNVFNGTNSVTGSSTLYNMDLDIYDIQNNIAIGDTSAEISLTSFQDFVMINTVVTKLNSQLPDATISIDSVEKQCDSKTIVVNYTVSNLNCTNPLPAGTSVSIYIDGQLFQTITTPADIPIGGSIVSQITIVLPDNVVSNFELKFVVDDTGNGTGIVAELNENNNTSIINDSLWFTPTFNSLENLLVCNEGFTRGTFDFSAYKDLVKTNPEDTVHFYETLDNADADVNTILNTSSYITTATPKEIFVRVSNQHCFSITSFLLTTRNCPPTVYNYVSANNDSYNDTFFIGGLRDIFLNFKLEIYSRWGRLLWTGNQNTEDWDGNVKEGVGSKNAPDGTYFYLLFLNDIDYPEPLQGFLYLNH
ncbi:gliding motility-associated C-terminal domain-containing protein [Flavobacterium paronense]|uniref:Gliding motility-associated C-terminal domain-containing protein n=1 Tax=Flavobacterium paronense TaxID=1392775 RepID=A0ABV5GFY7_9FLAO|nr:gliding motility-associated C-terminal domain-containing protein [Flavobacterium paronense]MDN3676604.1 gliding motility-associated C-terminal domain-containing protein [Flavobacterium paronense]